MMLNLWDVCFELYDDEPTVEYRLFPKEYTIWDIEEYYKNKYGENLYDLSLITETELSIIRNVYNKTDLELIKTYSVFDYFDEED